jgi:hypothetical protein
LTIGSFFFAHRSCEYLGTTGERKTKLLTLGDFRFHRHDRLLPLSDPGILLAETVTITYRDQKNGQKMQQRTHWRTDDPDFCPVRVWLAVVLRLFRRPDCDRSTSINTYHVAGRRMAVSATQVIAALRATATAIGFDALGFHAADIGTHSIRCAAAMAMAILNYPTWQIMITGRWNSDAFMGYIREQVDRLSHGVSTSMAGIDHFNTIPAALPHVAAMPNTVPGVGLHHIDGAPPDAALDIFPPMTSIFHNIDDVENGDRHHDRRHQRHPH